MANCSNCVRKDFLTMGSVAVEFTCPYGVSTVPIQEYVEDFSDEECNFYEKE